MDRSSLSVIASLLGSRAGDLEKALFYRVVGNKLGAIEKMHTRDQAEYGRDAFAKVYMCMYVCMYVCMYIVYALYVHVCM